MHLRRRRRNPKRRELGRRERQSPRRPTSTNTARAREGTRVGTRRDETRLRRLLRRRRRRRIRGRIQTRRIRRRIRRLIRRRIRRRPTPIGNSVRSSLDPVGFAVGSGLTLDSLRVVAPSDDDVAESVPVVAVLEELVHRNQLARVGRLLGGVAEIAPTPLAVPLAPSSRLARGIRRGVVGGSQRTRAMRSTGFTVSTTPYGGSGCKVSGVASGTGTPPNAAARSFGEPAAFPFSSVRVLGSGPGPRTSPASGSASSRLATNCSGQKSCSPRCRMGTRSRERTRRVFVPSCQCTSTRVCVPTITAVGRIGGTRASSSGASFPERGRRLRRRGDAPVPSPPSPSFSAPLGFAPFLFASPFSRGTSSARRVPSPLAVPRFTAPAAPAVSDTLAASATESLAAACALVVSAGSTPSSNCASASSFANADSSCVALGCSASTMARSPNCQHVCA